MMQESKPSCYGKWYLPAGRMEPNETIEVIQSTYGTGTASANLATG